MIKTSPRKAEGTKDFWMCETGTGEQVAKIRDWYMMMMMIVMIFSGIPIFAALKKNNFELEI
jgi:hypothetical protein